MDFDPFSSCAYCHDSASLQCPMVESSENICFWFCLQFPIKVLLNHILDLLYLSKIAYHEAS
jgi:hypothetical protein